jgi:hypothetical protein
MYLPLYSYVHVLSEDCPKGSVEQKYSFPNFYFCTGCDEEYNWLSMLQPYSNVMIQYHRDHRAQSIPLLTELDGFDYYGNFSCEERNTELNRIQEEKYCFVGDYVVSVLIDKLNFTRNPINYLNSHPQIVTYGMITELFSENIRTADAPWNFLLTETEMTVIYCDLYPTQSTKVSFRAWWAPYRWQVWGVFFLSLFVLSTVFAYFTLSVQRRLDQPSIRNIMLPFLRSWSDRWLGILRFVLRQDETQSLFLITCSYFMLIFTCLYENIITSQLIVPDETERYGSIDELAEDGYSIIILCDRAFMLERKLPNSVNQTIAEHFLRNEKSRDDFYQGVKFEFQEASSDSFLMDVGNVSHKYAVLQNINKIMIRHLENLMSKLHGVSCYRVRKSIAGSQKFIYFLNFLVYEQLRLA